MSTMVVDAATSTTDGVAVTDPELKTLQDKIMVKVKTMLPGSVTSDNSMVSNHSVNQWHFHNTSTKPLPVEVPTLLVHGYAASSMAFHRTFPMLSKNIRDLYAIDLPGNGLSTTPEADFPKLRTNKMEFNKEYSQVKLSKRVDTEKEMGTLHNYEDYYLDKIEQWRTENHIDKFNIVGHSFGGYISFKYAIRHPEHVVNMGLISPLGMERNVYSLNNDFKNDTEYPVTVDDPSSVYYSRNFKVPSFLFNSQLNALRYLGPVGGTLARKYIDRAYATVPGTEYRDYLYYIFYKSDKFPKTTINNFTNMFTRNLLAKDPILDNLSSIKARKVMLMYGDHDWMNGEAGYTMAQELAESHNYKPRSAVDFVQVPDAGHNLFLDNPDYFSKQIVAFLS